MMDRPTRRHAPRSVLALAAAALAAAALASALASLDVFAPAASARSSDHGASFAVRCDFSHRSNDDPIVHQGHAGMAHSHDFFGNKTTDADSTRESLLGEETTCTRPKDTAAYWHPTVSWSGERLDSNRAVFYYRAGGKYHKSVKPSPRG